MMQLPTRRRFLASSVLAGLSGAFVVTVGCLPQETKRAQVADDPDKDQFATIGMKTVIGNADPIPVSTVGLVWNLKGTGSVPQADGWRQMLENSLKKRKLAPKELLEDPKRSTSLVMVSANILPGSRVGDRLDVDVMLPPGSKTTSLKGGILDVCELTNYELAGNARQQLTDSGVGVGKVPQAQANSLLLGNRLAVAEGALVAGTMVQANERKPVEGESTGEDGGEPGLRVAKIWGGAICHFDRPYYFLLNDNAPQPRLAMVVASRLNSVFHGSGDRAGKIAEAKVQGKPLVAVFVPPTYRLNHMRFLMVARQVPLVPVTANDPSRKKLEGELLAPETAIVAALKLEAYGTESEDTLRVGLEEESPWVKFAAASSLCYLGKGDPRAAQALGELAAKHAALRSHCLIALASQDDAPCTEQLVELMRKGDASLRYGAFAALRTADESHEAIRGRRLGNSFHLHMVAPDSESLVHLTTERRNEIVLFGNVWPVSGPFSIPLGTEFTVSMKEGDKTVTISRIVTKKAEVYKTKEDTDADENYDVVKIEKRPDLSVLLMGIVEMGGNYTDAIELIRRLSAADCLGTKLAVDSAPRGISIQQLAQIARIDPTVMKANKEVERVQRGGDVLQSGIDLPSDADTLKKQPGDDQPALSRNPGRLFGPANPETGTARLRVTGN
jgi:hypothetical protein